MDTGTFSTHKDALSVWLRSSWRMDRQTDRKGGIDRGRQTRTDGRTDSTHNYVEEKSSLMESRMTRRFPFLSAPWWLTIICYLSNVVLNEIWWKENANFLANILSRLAMVAILSSFFSHFVASQPGYLTFSDVKKSFHWTFQTCIFIWKDLVLREYAQKYFTLE